MTVDDGCLGNINEAWGTPLKLIKIKIDFRIQLQYITL